MKKVHQYMTFFYNFEFTSSHLHPLQVENCDSNSRLVVDEDNNGKLRLERVKVITTFQVPGVVNNACFCCAICKAADYRPSSIPFLYTHLLGTSRFLYNHLADLIN